ELRYLWHRGLVERRLCGCGRPVPECPVWTAVLESAFGSVAAAPARDVVAVQQRVHRMRHVPSLLRDPRAADLVDYRAALERLYGALRDVTGAALVVDASKLPTYAVVLDTVDPIDLRLVHL